jgi:hypothetical protein
MSIILHYELEELQKLFNQQKEINRILFEALSNIVSGDLLTGEQAYFVATDALRNASQVKGIKNHEPH